MSCLPSLTKLDLLVYEATNFTPLLQHLPHNSLIELSLRQFDEDQAKQPDRAGLIHVSWTDVTAQALAKLTHLTSLKIDYSCNLDVILFHADASFDLSKHLPINSWPHLAILCIVYASLTTSQLAGLLGAAPALEEIKFVDILPKNVADLDLDDHEELNYPLAIVMIGHFCKHVHTLSIELSLAHMHSSAYLVDLRAALAQYPFQVDSFSQLRSLTLDSVSSPGIHLLLSHIAPQALQLEHVDLKTKTQMEMCMLRVVPNLRYLDMDAEFETGFASFTLFDMFSSHRQRDAPIFEDHNVKSPYFQPADDGKIYRTFRSELDAHGRNGRDEFFSLLYALLSAGDKAGMALYDEGKYNIEMCDCLESELCPLCRPHYDSKLQDVPDNL